MADTNLFVQEFRNAVKTFCIAFEQADDKVDMFAQVPTILDPYNYSGQPATDPLSKQDLLDAGGVMGEVKTFLLANGRLAKLMKLR